MDTPEDYPVNTREYSAQVRITAEDLDDLDDPATNALVDSIQLWALNRFRRAVCKYHNKRKAQRRARCGRRRK